MSKYKLCLYTASGTIFYFFKSKKRMIILANNNTGKKTFTSIKDAFDSFNKFNISSFTEQIPEHFCEIVEFENISDFEQKIIEHLV